MTHFLNQGVLEIFGITGHYMAVHAALADSRPRWVIYLRCLALRFDLFGAGRLIFAGALPETGRHRFFPSGPLLASRHGLAGAACFAL